MKYVHNYAKLLCSNFNVTILKKKNNNIRTKISQVLTFPKILMELL